jgi:hypothetical protein
VDLRLLVGTPVLTPSRRDTQVFDESGSETGISTGYLADAAPRQFSDEQDERLISRETMWDWTATEAPRQAA